MATLTTIRFSRDNIFYEVNIDLDDKAIMENLIACDVIAKATDEQGRFHSETLRVELDLKKFSGRILLRDQEIYQFTFGDTGVRMDPQTGEEAVPGMDGDTELKDKAYDHIQKGIGEAVGEMIDAMPVPDPFFGCLIKASISSIVGQVVTCNELRKNYGDGKRVSQILRCLKKHVKGIAFRTIWRAGRCILRLGF